LLIIYFKRGFFVVFVELLNNEWLNKLVLLWKRM